jgi:hypothetical protein
MSLPDWADTREAARDYYDDLARYESDRDDARQRAWEDNDPDEDEEDEDDDE